MLAPFLAAPDPESLEVAAGIVASTAPIAFMLRRLETFPDGVIYAPEPDEPFRTLTERFVAAFPLCPPYGGAFREIVPHVTLDQTSAEVSVESTRSRVLTSWRLGGTGFPWLSSTRRGP